MRDGDGKMGTQAGRQALIREGEGGSYVCIHVYGVITIRYDDIVSR